MPMMRFLSHLYLSKPSAFRFTETRDTWELSMACSWIPESAQSHDACFSRSLMASSTFFRRLPLTRRASNILARVWTQRRRRTSGRSNVISQRTWVPASLLLAQLGLQVFARFPDTQQANFAGKLPIGWLLPPARWLALQPFRDEIVNTKGTWVNRNYLEDNFMPHILIYIINNSRTIVSICGYRNAYINLVSYTCYFTSLPFVWTYFHDRVYYYQKCSFVVKFLNKSPSNFGIID